MSTWVLIVYIGIMTSQTTIVVQDLPSELVCKQLGKEVAAQSPYPDRPDLYEIQCYEIKNRFDGLVDPEYLELMK
jgi:hypothetical protein